MSDVEHVIQFDLPISPKEFESYTHRIGRTGRAGKTGFATAIYVPGNEPGFGNEDVAQLLASSLTENGSALPSWLPGLKGKVRGLSGKGASQSNTPSFDERMEERAMREGDDRARRDDENRERRERTSRDRGRGRGRGWGLRIWKVRLVSSRKSTWTGGKGELWGGRSFFYLLIFYREN